MINKEDIDVNNIDGNIVMINSVYEDMNIHWIKEINTDGDSFDFDSQDIYCHVLEKMLLMCGLVEKINPETQKEERQVLLEDLKKSINENIKLYENHKSLFTDLPRRSLIIKELRKRKYKESVKSDNCIYDTFELSKEIQNRDVYFSSELYTEIGFLERNFHEQIYNYAIYVKGQIENDFVDSNNYDQNYLMVYKTTFLNMGIVYHIHNTFCGDAFNEITELDLYKVLNLQNTIPYLKIKDNQKLLYILYRLSKLVDENLREPWLKGVLKDIGISKAYYDSKYKAVTWTNSSKIQKAFVKDLDTLFKDKISPIVS